MKILAEKNSNGANNDVRKLLSSYLDGAVALTAGKTKAEAKRVIKDYFKKADKEGLSGADAAMAVSEKEKALKEKAAAYDFKTKMNYFSDADTAPLKESKITEAVAAAWTFSALFANSGTVAATVFGTLSYYTVKGVAKEIAKDVTESKTDAEKISAQGYADIKHAQLALKLLKKEIEAPVKAAERTKYKEEAKKLFAAGYGLHSGGLAALTQNRSR
ncbi:MAG: hypothetical protein IKR09_02690 [Alphaproteobacteria bacterium]|nr:hypothetical protein [Alphaproteobacteria bacterium]